MNAQQCSYEAGVHDGKQVLNTYLNSVQVQWQIISKLRVTRTYDISPPNKYSNTLQVKKKKL